MMYCRWSVCDNATIYTGPYLSTKGLRVGRNSGNVERARPNRPRKGENRNTGSATGQVYILISSVLLRYHHATALLFWPSWGSYYFGLLGIAVMMGWWDLKLSPVYSHVACSWSAALVKWPWNFASEYFFCSIARAPTLNISTGYS